MAEAVAADLGADGLALLDALTGFAAGDEATLRRLEAQDEERFGRLVHAAYLALHRSGGPPGAGERDRLPGPPAAAARLRAAAVR